MTNPVMAAPISAGRIIFIFMLLAFELLKSVYH